MYKDMNTLSFLVFWERQGVLFLYFLKEAMVCMM